MRGALQPDQLLVGAVNAVDELIGPLDVKVGVKQALNDEKWLGDSGQPSLNLALQG
jgi:hypothetical protein